jgi:glycosyltransferase involved in cell wall biosynthesis
MKSVILVGPVPPPYGGMATYLSTLASCLQSAGYQVSMETTTAGQTSNLLLSKFSKISRFLEIGIRVAIAHPQVVQGFTGSQDNFMAMGSIMWIARLTKKQVFLRISGGDFPGMIASAGGLKKTIIRSWLKGPHFVIAVSDAIREATINAGVAPEQVLRISSALPNPTVVKNGFIPEQVATLRKRCQPFVVSIGAFQEHYGVHLLLEAISGLRSNFPGIGLLLIMKNRPDIGAGPYEKKILRQIDALDLTAVVEILRDIPHSQVLEIIKQADLFVRPTLIDGDSNSIREAMMHGVPVVASRVGHRPDGIWLYEPDNLDVGGVQTKMMQALTSVFPGLSTDIESEAARNMEQLIILYDRTMAGLNLSL